MKYNAELISDNLEILRTSKGMTKGKLADKLGMAPSALYKKRKGKLAWNLNETLLLCQLFEVSINDLVLSKIVPIGTKI